MDIKSLVSSFSSYTLVGVLSSGVGFILMPILTHHLSTEDYGSLALFNSYASILVPFIGFVATGLISVEFYNKELSKKDFSSLFTSVTFIPIIPFIFILILTILLRSYLEEWLDIKASFVYMLPIMAILIVYQEQFLNYLIIARKAKAYTLLSITKTFLEVSLVLLLVVALTKGWTGRVNASAIVLAISISIGLFYFLKIDLLIKKIKFKYILAGLSYGSPLIFHTIGKVIVNQSDRIFINQMVSKSEVGIYNTGYLIGSIIMIIGGAFINVYTPFLYERLSDINEKKKLEIVRLSYIFLGGLFIVFLVLTLISPLLFNVLIDIKYRNGVQYVFWTGLGYFFWGIYLIFAGYIFYLKKTIILALLAILNVILNIFLNYVLIGLYGTIGASYATCISFFTLALIIALISTHHYPMPWLNFKKIIWDSSKE